MRPGQVGLETEPTRTTSPKGRLRRGVYDFTVRYPWLGYVVWVASSLYFLAQITVAWVWKPPYSAAHNTISDLGNTHCGQYGGGYVCSPRHALMNAGFIYLGAVMVIGSLLIYQEFRERRQVERRAALAGFSLMSIGGLGAILVGCFPENTFGAAHGIGAGLAIGGGNLGIFILGLVLPLREGMRTSMLLWAALSMTAAVLFALHRNFGIGPGAMERIAQYPESVWLIRFGIYISRNHYSGPHARDDPRKLFPDRQG